MNFSRACVSTGGTDKRQLLAQAWAHCNVGPYVQHLVWSPRFPTLLRPEEVEQIILTPRDLGFEEPPTRTQLFNEQRLAEWSRRNLKGYIIDLNPPEIGLQRALQLSEEKVEPIRIAMEPIPVDGVEGVFEISRRPRYRTYLVVSWMRPDFEVDLDTPFSFRLKKAR